VARPTKVNLADPIILGASMYVLLIQWVSPGDQSRTFDLPHGIAAHNNGVYLADGVNTRPKFFDRQEVYIS
jgi:hypothetical protein